MLQKLLQTIVCVKISAKILKSSLVGPFGPRSLYAFMYYIHLNKAYRKVLGNYRITLNNERLSVRYFLLDKNDVLIYAKIKQHNVEISKRGFYLNRCHLLGNTLFQILRII